MFVINCVETKYIRGENVPISKPVEFEFYKDINNATHNLNYLMTIFGKHYRFYITEKNEKRS